MDVTKKIQYQSNAWYDDGLRKAQIRDLSGAITSLRKSLQYNRENIQARNLLGLVYYGRGELVEALAEWIISKNLKPRENRAEVYIRKLQANPVELEKANQAIRNFNLALEYANQGNEDLAVIQLKQVVADAPSFVKAYQLLALLYLHGEQYGKARHALRSARKLDSTDPWTLRYLHEVTQHRAGKHREERQVAEDSVAYQVGNDTVIVPAQAAFKGTALRIAALNLTVGLLIGAALVGFLILPAVSRSRMGRANDQIAQFSSRIQDLETQIEAQTRALDEYRATSDETQEAQATAASTQQSYENLMVTEDQYTSMNYTSATMAETLLGVNREALGANGQALYDMLAGEIFTVVAQRQFEAGTAALEAGDLSGAIAALEQVVQMNEQYGGGTALLQLGRAYARSGNTQGARERFDRVLELFGDTQEAQEAQAEIDALVAAG